MCCLMLTHSTLTVSVYVRHTLIRRVLFDADSFYTHSISVCQAHTPIRRVLFDVTHSTLTVSVYVRHTH